MRIEFAHLRQRSTTGQMVDFAVFHAKANGNTDADRQRWLSELGNSSSSSRRKVDVAALVYQEGTQMTWWGHPFVGDFINRLGVPSANYYVKF